MKVLVACEESQRVCTAFRGKGHEAYSCDIQECSGGHPEWHILGDVLPILDGNTKFITQDGTLHEISGKWDMIIAHPPCTYLTVTGNRWFNIEKYGKKAIKRYEQREEAIDFFSRIVNANCDKIAIENPVGIMSTVWRKPTQVIHPFMFGEPFEKRTCLWLKNLPKLNSTKLVSPPERIKFKSGKTMSEWYAKAWGLPEEERKKERSRTFVGIARAMAEQWGAQGSREKN